MKNAKKIEIRGVIVGSTWDEPMLASYIDRGVLTPLSRVSAALKEAAAADEAVEIHVNSIGGDVLAGNQMLAEIQDFKGAKKIVLGGMAASMAANLVLLAGCKVEAHENSILLFHSARSEVEGEPDALRDEAKLLDSINAPMIARLKALGIPEADVDEGFKAGRQFSLSAEEALSYGIVSKIRPGAGPVPETVTDAELQELAAKDQRVAALLAPAKAEAETPAEDKPTDAPPPETVEDKPAEVQAPAPSEPVEDLKAQLAEARAAAEKSEANARTIQSATAKKINDLETKLKAATEALEALRSQTEKTISDLQADKRKIAADLADERANRARLVGGMIAPDASETGIADAASFHAALDALPDASARVAFIREHAAQIKALAARQGVNP